MPEFTRVADKAERENRCSFRVELRIRVSAVVLRDKKGAAAIASIDV
jgi:hypothetical protein